MAKRKGKLAQRAAELEAAVAGLFTASATAVKKKRRKAKKAKVLRAKKAKKVKKKARKAKR